MNGTVWTDHGDEDLPAYVRLAEVEAAADTATPALAAVEDLADDWAQMDDDPRLLLNPRLVVRDLRRALTVTDAALARSLGDGAGGSGDNRRHPTEPTTCRFCDRPATGSAYPEPQTKLTRRVPSCGAAGHGIKFAATT